MFLVCESGVDEKGGRCRGMLGAPGEEEALLVLSDNALMSSLVALSETI